MDAMKTLLAIAALGLAVMLSSSCTNTGGGIAGNHPSGTGPFDARGNYVEEWADNPSKWRRGGTVPSKPGESLDLAANDQPPLDSVPIPTAANTRDVGEIGPVPVISKPAPSAVRKTSGSSSSSTVVAKKRPTTSSSSATASRPKPKTAVAAKAKPKAKTASRYTIRKGDTLSAIAARNGTSVAALQRANGIKGSLIQPGKSLVIPR